MKLRVIVPVETERERLLKFAQKVVQRDKMVEVVAALHYAAKLNTSHADQALLWWTLSQMRKNRKGRSK